MRIHKSREEKDILMTEAELGEELSLLYQQPTSLTTAAFSLYSLSTQT